MPQGSPGLQRYRVDRPRVRGRLLLPRVHRLHAEGWLCAGVSPPPCASWPVRVDAFRIHSSVWPMWCSCPMSVGQHTANGLVPMPRTTGKGSAPVARHKSKGPPLGGPWGFRTPRYRVATVQATVTGSALRPFVRSIGCLDGMGLCAGRVSVIVGKGRRNRGRSGWSRPVMPLFKAGWPAAAAAAGLHGAGPHKAVSSLRLFPRH